MHGPVELSWVAFAAVRLVLLGVCTCDFRPLRTCRYTCLSEMELLTEVSDGVPRSLAHTRLCFYVSCV